jgi:hypothetical protein
LFIYIKSNKPCSEKQIFKVTDKDTKGTNKVIRHARLKNCPGIGLRIKNFINQYLHWQRRRNKGSNEKCKTSLDIKQERKAESVKNLRSVIRMKRLIHAGRDGNTV